MLTADQILLEDEQLIGDYNMEIARWTRQRWTSTVPSLYVVITDRRLVIQPHGRKRRAPAIIPASHILHVRPLDDTPRAGISLRLKSDHRITLFVPAANHQAILQTIRQIATPRQRVDRPDYQINLDLGSLQKLIDYFNRL